jgi:hypothetical protein
MRKSVFVTSAIAALLLAGWLVSCKNGYGTKPIVVTGELNSGTIPASGGAFPHTFNTLGSFRYKCVIHPTCASLQGAVVVVSPSTLIATRTLSLNYTGGSSGTYAVCSILSQPADTVHVGDTVTWTNNSPLPHTVSTY